MSVLSIRKRIVEIVKGKSPEPTENTEQLPVYDIEWLNSLLNKYWVWYGILEESYPTVLSMPSRMPLDLKASAGIILEALAKELNVNNDSLIDYEIIAYQDGKYSVTRCRPETAYFGEVKFAWNTAQKAIDILSTHFPEVLKNYFL
jgi:hypothetical protein